MSSESSPESEYSYTLAWAHHVKSKQSQAQAMQSMNQFKLVGPMMNTPQPPSPLIAQGGASPAPSSGGAMAHATAPPPMAPSPEGEAPPPYTTMPRVPAELGASHWTGPGAIPGAYVPRGVKLGYMDFVPRLVRKRVLKDNEYETFDTLLQRANNWLEEHEGIRLVSCETVMWFGMSVKHIYSDSCAFAKSMNASQKTKYHAGLRLWYLQDMFPSPVRAQAPPVIISRTFIPRDGERFDQLITRVNQALGKDKLGGYILSIETVKAVCKSSDYRPGLVNPNLTYWTEDPEYSRVYAMCLRVYAILAETAGYETIGYQDFIPEQNKRNKENKGYEVFSDVMARAARWIAGQQGVRFTNVQSINVKLKSKGPFEERSVYTEHQCANNRGNLFTGPSRVTRYVRIVRAYFTILQGVPPGMRNEIPSARITYRTFSPAQISNTSRDKPIDYEETRRLLERINQWLQITGAQVFGIETVAVRQTKGSLQMLGPEATYSSNNLPAPYTEKWLYHIRVYLTGEYMEPPGAVSLVVPNVAVVQW